MQDKKVRISVDDAKIRDLRGTANELARDMIMSSRQYSTSSKQVIKDIEEQIKLIEKRNKLDQNLERAKVHSRYVGGQISEPQRRTELGRISAGGQTDDIQIKLLREIIDTIRATAKEEIREDRLGVEHRIRESKTVNQLSPKDDAERILREPIQQGELGEVDREEATERRDFTSFSGGAKKENRALAQVAGAQSEWGLGAMILGSIPTMVGAGIALDRLTRSSKQFEQSAAKLGTHRGYGVDEASSLMKTMGGRDYSFDLSDVSDRYTNYRTAGQRDYSREQMGRMFGAERMLGLSTENISAVAGTTRYSKADPSFIIAELETHLRKTSQDISLLPELIDSYASAANNLLQITTSGDTSRVATGLVSLAQTTGTSGASLNQWSQGIQGLGQSQNPMVRAMLMREMMDNNPTNKSMFELEAMMEDPLGNMDAIGGVLGNIQNILPGDMGLRAIHSFFGGKVSKSEILKRKDSNFAGMTSDYQEGGMSQSKIFGNESSKHVSDLERSEKFVNYYIQSWGQSLTSSISDLGKILIEIQATTNAEQALAVEKGVGKALEADRQKGNQFPTN